MQRAESTDACRKQAGSSSVRGTQSRLGQCAKVACAVTGRSTSGRYNISTDAGASHRAKAIPVRYAITVKNMDAVTKNVVTHPAIPIMPSPGPATPRPSHAATWRRRPRPSGRCVGETRASAGTMAAASTTAKLTPATSTTGENASAPPSARCSTCRRCPTNHRNTTLTNAPSGRRHLTCDKCQSADLG